MAAHAGVETIEGEDRLAWRGQHGQLMRGYAFGEIGKPGVVLLQEWWGVTQQLRDQAAMIASKGFRVLVPDLYHEDDMHPGHRNVMAVVEKQDFSDEGWWRAMSHGIVEDHMPGVEATVHTLIEEGSPRVAVVGLCLGGAMAVTALAKIADVSAAVTFSGVPHTALLVNGLEKPLQAHFGEESKAAGFSDSKAVDTLKEQFKAPHQQEVHLYLNVGHTFMSSHESTTLHRRKMELKGRHVDTPENVELAWERTVSFLQRTVI